MLQEMITVEGTEDEIHVTIPRGELEPGQIEELLRPLRFAWLVANSRMTKAEAIEIAEESKADWWEKNEHRFVSAEK